MAEYFNRLLAAEWPPNEALLSHLIDFAARADPLPQVAATGLLKRYKEAGAAFPEAISLRLLDLLSGAARWQARLHLLQMLPSLPIPEGRAAMLEDFLKGCLAGEKIRFIRGWGIRRTAPARDASHSLARAGGREFEAGAA